VPVSEIESAERPSMDLFKAIFENSEPSGSSSSEASDDEDEDKHKDKQQQTVDDARSASIGARVGDSTRFPDTAVDIGTADFAVSSASPLTLQILSEQPQPEPQRHSELVSLSTDTGKNLVLIQYDH